MREVKFHTLYSEPDGVREEIPALKGKDALVQSVSAGGMTLTPDANGNVDVPIAAGTSVGLVRAIQNSYGIYVNNGTLRTDPADEYWLTKRYNNNEQPKFRPVVPAMIDLYVKGAMCDGIGPAWSSEEQNAACARAGAERKFSDGWTLKGAFDMSNKDDGVTVDLAGCSEVFFKGFVTGTGGSDLRCNVSSDRMVYQFVYNGTRYIRMLYATQPMNGGIMPIVTQWSTAPSLQGDKLTSYTVGAIDANWGIQDITKFYFTAPQNITAIDMQIYAR